MKKQGETMLNLYEILEVSEKASKEVIEKAYRVLAKKYHPDLQQGTQKQEAEKKMKQINEAYEILSDDEKRKEYDIQLEQERQMKKEQEVQKEKQIQQQVESQIIKNQIQKEESIKQEKEIAHDENSSYQNAQILQNEMKKAYRQAYYHYLRSLGYKIKEPWTLKRLIELLKVLIILAIIIAVIWFFPPTNKLIVQFYEENAIIKTIVEILVNIVKGIGNAMVQFIQNIVS